MKYYFIRVLHDKYFYIHPIENKEYHIKAGRVGAAIWDDKTIKQALKQAEKSTWQHYKKDNPEPTRTKLYFEKELVTSELLPTHLK